MADPTFGVKVTSDFKEKVEELVKKSDFKTTKEWFEHLVGTYELQLLKENVGAQSYIGDIEAIESLTSRIVIILKSLVQKATDSFQISQDEFQAYKSKSDHEASLAHSRIDELQTEVSLKQKEIKQIHDDQKEIRKQVSQLEELTISRKQVIEAKEAENDDLKKRLLELSQGDLRNENQRLQNELNQLRHEIQLKEMAFNNEIAQERVRSENNKEQIILLKQQISDYQQMLTVRRPPGRPKNEPNETSSLTREQKDQLELTDQLGIAETE
ncbi:hypothetical protein [Paenibacillus oryzisoli]|uniref:Chromosome partition protein Smc n=1 Tax=Paenibacillus oryzisoli TaxID=1850517 RepID=A0A198AJG6_9BACL|nr:hypothetical protein [Paenibacillus oryzisoli]OAS21372.1 hypothetical protein A8708_31385 [Paenibacillus oryzisoli]